MKIKIVSSLYITQLIFSIILVLFESCERDYSSLKTEPLQPKKGTITGTVISNILQQPIKNAGVYLNLNQVTDTTDSSGSFLLDNLGTGQDTIRVSAKYYNTLSQQIKIIDDTQNVILYLDVDPEFGCIPAEDTGRVYIAPNSGAPIPIYPRALFARFYPEVTDTNQIKEVLQQYNLKKTGYFFGLDGQWAAFLCITDNKRAECHFTPWGRKGFNNFGTHPIVEYCFGVFSWGFISFWGNIRFKFFEGTPQAQIDSLFSANGLRFLYTRPYPGGGIAHVTLITPQAPKNVLDLGDELQTVPLIEALSVELATSPVPIQCD